MTSHAGLRDCFAFIAGKHKISKLQLHIINVVRCQLAVVSIVVVVVDLPLHAPLPSLAGGRRHCDTRGRLCIRFTEVK